VAWYGEESVIFRVSVDGKRGGVAGKAVRWVRRCEHMGGLAQRPSAKVRALGRGTTGQQEGPERAWYCCTVRSKPDGVGTQAGQRRMVRTVATIEPDRYSRECPSRRPGSGAASGRHSSRSQ
jgi:hypothetical protein